MVKKKKADIIVKDEEQWRRRRASESALDWTESRLERESERDVKKRRD